MQADNSTADRVREACEFAGFPKTLAVGDYLRTYPRSKLGLDHTVKTFIEHKGDPVFSLYGILPTDRIFGPIDDVRV